MTAWRTMRWKRALVPERLRLNSLPWPEQSLCRLLVTALAGCHPVFVEEDGGRPVSRRLGQSVERLPSLFPLAKRYEHLVADAQEVGVPG